jgi:hypothetical protein
MEGMRPYCACMFDKFPSLRIKRCNRKGELFELEVRASFLHWLLIAAVVITLLAKGFGPIEALRVLLRSAPVARSSEIFDNALPVSFSMPTTPTRKYATAQSVKVSLRRPQEPPQLGEFMLKVGNHGESQTPDSDKHAVCTFCWRVERR